MFGGITGDAPLFERFSLGDSRTLRGWDKYDITPVGGDRMFYASAEYRYADCSPCSSIPDRSGTQGPRSVSASLPASDSRPGPVFFMVGFPLNTDEFRAVFTMGIRFSTSGLGYPTGRTDRGPPIHVVGAFRPAGPSSPALRIPLTLLAWAVANLGAQAVTVSRVADAVAVRAPGFTFIKGEPLVRLKDGRSVRADLDLSVLPRPGDPPAARSPADVCAELRSLGRAIRRDARRTAARNRRRT